MDVSIAIYIGFAVLFIALWITHNNKSRENFHNPVPKKSYTYGDPEELFAGNPPEGPVSSLPHLIQKHLQDCSVHCIKNQSGDLENAYGCCDCAATIEDEYEPNFQLCMCDLGYENYCFKQSTDLLLSQ